MKRLIIFLKLSFFVVIANSQILFYPEIDSASQDIYTLYKQKKISIAQQLVNKLIANYPNEGINYFNRAVLLFYKPGYPFSRKNPVRDARIIVDCKKAIKLGYKNSEIYYLIFSQYYNCDPNNEHIYSCRFDSQEESLEIRYEKLIAPIDTVQIGNKKVANVKASISNSVDSPLLLGQSVLKRFGKVTIDYKNGVIHFED